MWDTLSSWSGADIGGKFSATRTKFTIREETVYFPPLTVDKTASSEEAKFYDPVDFNNIRVGGNLRFQRAHFSLMTMDGARETGKQRYSDKRPRIKLFGARVGGEVAFRKASFSGLPELDLDLDASDARFLDFILLGRVRKSINLHSLDLTRTIIERRLRIQKVKVSKLMAGSIQVKGTALLHSLKIGQEAILEHGKISRFEFSDTVSWPPTPGRDGDDGSGWILTALGRLGWPPDEVEGRVRLGGLRYDHITRVHREGNKWQDGPDDKKAKQLLELLGGAVLEANVYAHLEEFFLTQGRPDQADEVYVAYQRRQRERLSQSKWLWNVFLERLVNYGRSPHFAFFWSLLLVGIGAAVFWRRDGMEPKNPDDASRAYNGIWYSMDLLLPFIDLQAVQVWEPRVKRRYARIYMRVQTLLGWVLIPIGLAAVTGLVK